MNTSLARGLVVAGLSIGSVMGSGPAAAQANPTDGFFAFPQGGDWSPVALGTEPVEIQRITLPAGSYIVQASAALATEDTQVTHFVACGLGVAGVIQGELSRGLLGGATPPTFLTLSLTAGFAIDATQDLSLVCVTDVPDVVISQPSPITAIRVDSLTVSGGRGF